MLTPRNHAARVTMGSMAILRGNAPCARRVSFKMARACQSVNSVPLNFLSATSCELRVKNRNGKRLQIVNQTFSILMILMKIECNGIASRDPTAQIARENHVDGIK